MFGETSDDLISISLLVTMISSITLNRIPEQSIIDIFRSINIQRSAALPGFGRRLRNISAVITLTRFYRHNEIIENKFLFLSLQITSPRKIYSNVHKVMKIMHIYIYVYI